VYRSIWRVVYGLHGYICSVAKVASLRILLAIVAVKDLEIHEMDVITTFLLGNLHDTKLQGSIKSQSAL
jgi:hypothetical protein